MWTYCSVRGHWLCYAALLVVHTAWIRLVGRCAMHPPRYGGGGPGPCVVRDPLPLQYSYWQACASTLTSSQHVLANPQSDIPLLPGQYCSLPDGKVVRRKEAAATLATWRHAGTFERDNRTVFVSYEGAGSYDLPKIRQLLEANFRQFGPVNNIYISHPKNIAFVR